MTDELRDPLWDDAPSEDELSEAAALARALERETLAEGQLEALLPALEAGHLLQMARAPELSEARLHALFAELEESLPATRPEASRGAVRRPWWHALRAWLLVGTSAGAAAALGLWLSARDAAAPAEVATLPPATMAVLEAQLSAAQRRSEAGDSAPPAGDGDPSAPPLAVAMRPYRAELLAHLASEYTP